MQFTNKHINPSLLIMSREKQAAQAKSIYQQQPKDSQTMTCWPNTDHGHLHCLCGHRALSAKVTEGYKGSEGPEHIIGIIAIED